MDSGIGIELADTATGAAGRRVFELAEAQFDRYRPPTHRYLLLDLAPDETDWIPLTGCIGQRRTAPWSAALLPTFTRPLPGRLADLDRWYTDHHVPEVVSVAGFVAGQRFAHRNPAVEHPRLALYELETDDPGAALVRLTAALATMVQTDALDGSSIASWLYLPVSAAASR